MFEGEVKLPYGVPTHQLFYFERDTPGAEYTEHELAREQRRSEDFKVSAEPQFVLSIFLPRGVTLEVEQLVSRHSVW